MLCLNADFASRPRRSSRPSKLTLKSYNNPPQQLRVNLRCNMEVKRRTLYLGTTKAEYILESKETLLLQTARRVDRKLDIVDFKVAVDFIESWQASENDLSPTVLRIGPL